MVKVLLVLLCLILPFLAVLIKKGPCIEVLWALLLQLLGHIPGVIYGIYQVVKDYSVTTGPRARPRSSWWTEWQFDHRPSARNAPTGPAGRFSDSGAAYPKNGWS